ncbi:transcription factor IBH1 [Ziziphus jujuba]|uniref:Transcription factor IBH1 n=2 Tax=Ziziphus jujuba TaxID=326968 RepID=A0A6P4AE81_ZIZJJ|nr:transcription factor IBH1 [Ziziphus jujuba]KAH7518753.1 hypothetical protein FEM48_Zijuj09G0204500 [Ziziphus jujuba var. spinosa]
MNPKPLSSTSITSTIKSRFTQGFLRALKRINRQKPRTGTPPPSSSREICKRYLKVKVAADASMACAVGSRRAWSRAMLRKIRSQSTCVKVRRRTRFRMKKKESNEKEDGNPKAMELRKLVPGGEAMEICKLLDETAHYIKCLSTQVKVMRRIADFYSSN